MSLAEKYIELFQAHEDNMFDTQLDAMNELRNEAISSFALAGFPTQKVEDYKYINVKRAFTGIYDYHASKGETARANEHLVVNDLMLTDAFYGQAADMSDPIVALNTALAQDCLCIHVRKNETVERPIEIKDILRADCDTQEHKRVIIVVDDGASASVLFHYTAPDRVAFLTTQVVEVFVGNNARLNIYEIEETHTRCTRFSNIFFKVGRDSTVTHSGVVLFNGLTRNTIRVDLLGQYSQATLNGCVLASKNQTVDNNTLVRHLVPDCTSNELYKYVIDDSAVGAFAGKVYVKEGAQHTSSNEVNQNICLSDDARMFTQPMLEIYADDVKCAHGSTVGKLDEASLFYMRQRGIPLDVARMLLVQAFIAQVVELIPLQNLRDRLHLMVEKRLRGELDKCQGCGICGTTNE